MAVKSLPLAGREIHGAIVDSWVEPSGPPSRGQRLVLQVALSGSPRNDLVIVEAEASLVPDLGWLEDLGENMCHGSPVSATGEWVSKRLLSAHTLRLIR